MANNDGQQARNWKPLDFKASQKAYDSALKNITDKQQREALKAIFTLTKAYVQELYGNPSEEKYRNIVDLIIERLTVVLDETKTTILDETFEEFKESVVTLINETLAEANLGLKLSNSDIENVVEAIQNTNFDVFQEKIDETKLFLTEISSEFESKIDNLIHDDENNDIDAKNDDGKQQTIAKNDEIDEKTSNDELSEFNKYQKNVKKLVQTLQSNVDKLLTVVQFDAVNMSLAKIQQTLQQTVQNDISNIQNTANSLNSINNMSKKTQETVGQIEQLVPTKKEQKLNKIFYEITESINRATKAVLSVFSDIATLILDNIEFVLDTLIKQIYKIILQLFTKLILPLCILIGVPLKLALEPLAKIVVPIFNIIGDVIKGLIDMVGSVILAVFRPLRDFIMDVIGPPLKKLLDNIAENLADIVREVSPHIATVFQSYLSFCTKLALMLTAFLKPITDNANFIGQKLMSILLLLVNVFTEFFSGMDDYLAFKLGEGLAKFAVNVVDVFILFFKGFGSVAREIGQEAAIFFITSVQVVTAFLQGLLFGNTPKKFAEIIMSALSSLLKIVPILTQIAKVFILYWLEVVDTIVSFVQGMGVFSYEIGKAIGEFMVNVAMLRLAYIREFKPYAAEIGKIIANEFIDNTDKVMKGLKLLVIQCGGMPVEVGDKLGKFYEFMNNIKGMTGAIDDMLSGELNFDRLKSHAKWLSDMWTGNEVGDVLDRLEDKADKLKDIGGSQNASNIRGAIWHLTVLGRSIHQMQYLIYNKITSIYKLFTQFFGIDLLVPVYYMFSTINKGDVDWFNDQIRKNYGDVYTLGDASLETAKAQVLATYVKNIKEQYTKPSESMLGNIQFTEEEKYDVNNLLDSICTKLECIINDKNIIYNDILKNNQNLLSVMHNPEFVTVEI